MVMKDKLVKTNHKAPYYLMKKISIGLLAIASMTFAIAVPTYIIHASKTKNSIGLAEENTSEVVEEELSENESYESYNN